ncbi:MAG: Ig-like domain repeat protein, partial [Methanobacteriaceae archaeon]|nr:Ig-like domain repeat protein [Methanobacteriaceae archaeon]
DTIQETPIKEDKQINNKEVENQNNENKKIETQSNKEVETPIEEIKPVEIQKNITTKSAISTTYYVVAGGTGDKNLYTVVSKINNYGVNYKTYTIYLSPGTYNFWNNPLKLSGYTKNGITVNFKGSDPKTTILTGNNNVHMLEVFGNYKIHLSGLTFTNGYDSNCGGAIYVDEIKQFTIDNCIFSNNEGGEGGAIFSFADMTVKNSVFSNNIATANMDGVGGSISGGGAIYLYGTSVNVYASTFKNNEGFYGGAIFGGGYVGGCTFTGNKATKYGGALAFDGTINGSSFTNNYAKWGGAIYGGPLKITGSSFTSNSAGSGGGAIATEGNSGVSHTNSITTCSFSDNYADYGGSIRVYKYSSISSANNNWWGTNSGPDTANDGADNGICGFTKPSIYVIMRFSNTTSYSNGQVNLVASLNRLNNGNSISGLPKRTVTFTSTSGTFNPSKNSFSSSSTTTYTGSATTFKATIDDQVLSLTLQPTTTKKETYTVEDSLIGHLGDYVQLKSTVRTTNGVLVTKGTVDFYVALDYVGSSSVYNGIATYNYKIQDLPSGMYEVAGYYKGNDNYYSSSGYGTLTVESNIKTYTTVNSVIGVPTTNVQLKANIRTTNGALVSGGTVYFLLDFEYVGSSSVSNGVASCNYKISDTKSGTYTLTAEYYGTTEYDPSTGTGTLKVQKVNINTVVTSITGAVNEIIPLTATFKTNSGTHIYGGVALFYIDGTNVGKCTVSKGIATCNYKIPISKSAGLHTIHVDYSGTTTYTTSTGNGILTIQKDIRKTYTTVTSVIGVPTTNVQLKSTIKNCDGNIISSGFVKFYIDGQYIGNTNVINGIATYNYKIPANQSIGTYTLTAEYQETTNYDSSIGTGTLKIQKVNIRTGVNSQSGTAGNLTQITATFKTNSGTHIYGGVALFYIDGTYVGKCTVSKGIATCNYKIPISKTVGSHIIQIVYNGTITYATSTGKGILTIQKDIKNTETTVTSVIGVPTTNIQLKATVKNSENKPVTNGTISFYINGTYICNRTVSNGIATANYKIPTNSQIGVYDLTAIYHGSNNLNPSTGVGTLKIQKVNVNTVVNSQSGIVGTVTQLKSTFKTNSGTPIYGGVASFYVGGTYVGKCTVSNGIATYNYKIPNNMLIRKYDIQVIYSGTTTYATSKGTGILNVLKS